MTTKLTLVTPEIDVDGVPRTEDIRRRIVLAGYTGVVVTQGMSPSTFYVEIAETTTKPLFIDKVKNVPAELPALYVDCPFISISGCGAACAEITVMDSRGTEAAGKEIEVEIQAGMLIPIDKDRAILDEEGTAVFTVGPTPIPSMASAPFKLTFKHVTDESRTVACVAQFVRGRRAAQIVPGDSVDGRVRYEARRPGEAGNEIFVEHYKGFEGKDHKDRELAIFVKSTKVIVAFGTDADGNSSPLTARAVAAKVNAHPIAKTMVRACAYGSGAGLAGLTEGAIPLAGGKDPE